MRIALVLLAACSSTSSTPATTAPVVEEFAHLVVGPGNIAVTTDKRIFISQHQFYQPTETVVEVKGKNGSTNETVPFAKEAGLDSVLGIRADGQGIVWMLDNAMKSRGTRKLVGWNFDENKLDRMIDLTSSSPADAFLNDFAIDRTNGAIYIADPAGGKNAALIVVDLATNTARRVLEGDASVIPTEIDLVIDRTPVQIKLPDGKIIKPHVGVNPIALGANDEWLYFGPMHSTKLYRVRTADLRDPSKKPAVERYADRPITDGISIDSAGNIYLGDLANNAIGVIGPDRKYRELYRSPLLSWVDAFSFSPDGYYYVIANQLHKSAMLNAGVDETRQPFHILRFKPLAPGRVGR